ncbi:putative holin-like toxin [Bacillus sp. CGMCC 1.16607]
MQVFIHTTKGILNFMVTYDALDVLLSFGMFLVAFKKENS